MLDMEFPVKEESDNMPSVNHSYLCSQILRQLFAYSHLEVMPELTLDIDNGLTPDICVYSSDVINPDFLHDIHKFPQMPFLAIEVISASQNIQTLLEKAQRMIDAGIKIVWTVEPCTLTIFVTTKENTHRFYNQEVQSENVKVDFKTIFSKQI